jgi:hypothetical protein
MQAKRQIGPGKLASYLNAIPNAERKQLLGLICGLRGLLQARRDTLREWCVEHAISEF